MSFCTEIEKSILKYIRKHKIHMEVQKTSNSQSNYEQKVNCWMHQNTRLQTILQSHNNKNSMVLAQNRQEDQWIRIEDPDISPTDLQQRSLKHTMEKRQPLQQMLLRKLDIYMWKTKTRSLSFMLYQNQLKVDQRPSYKA
jgi:hypothetical protein